MKEEDQYTHLYFACGSGDKFDKVVIVGQEHQKEDIEKLQQEAKDSGQRICIIGDGKNPIPSYKFLEGKLKGKVSEHAVMCIWGHGSVTKGDRGLLHHTTDIVAGEEITSRLLKFCTTLYPENPSSCARIHLFSCHGGAAIAGSKENTNVPIIAHSGKKYTTIMEQNWSIIRSIIKEPASENPYKHLLKYLLDTETAYFKVGVASGSNKKILKLAALKEALPIEEVRKHLQGNATELFDFFQGAFGHDSKNAHKTEILNKFKESITDDDVCKKYAEDTFYTRIERIFNRRFENSTERTEKFNKLQDYLEGYINNKYDINAVYKDGFTALYIAAKRGNNKFIKQLIEKGADVDIADKNGLTPLHMAASSGNNGAAEALIEKGADVDKADKYGLTPLYMAAHNGYANVARLLIANGADVYKTNNDGNTPLHIGALRGHLEVVTLLIEKGADVDKADKDGLTPLYMAAHNGYANVARLLIAKGADVYKTNKDGNTPLDIASQNRHGEVVKALLEAQEINVNKCFKICCITAMRLMERCRRSSGRDTQVAPFSILPSPRAIGNASTPPHPSERPSGHSSWVELHHSRCFSTVSGLGRPRT